MKIALVHEYLGQSGGAERVLKTLHDVWPDAPIFVWFYDPTKFNGEFDNADIRTSFIQKLPGSHTHYQWYLPLMPMATERHRLDEFDVVVSSSSAFGKGVLTGPQTLHICYCHTPTRYLWTDTHEYLKELPYSTVMKRFFILPLLHRLRVFDRMSADRVDHFIANSETVRRRINKFYRREARVVYPPVDTALFTPVEHKNEIEHYFVTGGRLAPVKKFDLVIEAFRRARKMKLKIFGTGPHENALKAMARQNGCTNIEFLGNITDAEKAHVMRHALAFIHPQLEDFGITAIESMAAGRPVIAYGAGGATETVLPGVTGTFFYEQTWEALLDTILAFKPFAFDRREISEHAAQFNQNKFKTGIKQLVEDAWLEHSRGMEQPSLLTHSVLMRP